MEFEWDEVKAEANEAKHTVENEPVDTGQG